VKKILVTGGAGFVGSNLCADLVKNDKNEIYSLDNYFTGSRKNHVSGVEYIEGSTRDIETFVQIKPDLIFHLGEYSRVEQSFKDIENLWDYNYLSIKHVLDFALKSNSKLIYAGSSTKFSNTDEGFIHSPYAWCKKINTELVKNYGAWFGLEYAITYFYNVYGTNEINEGEYATVVAKFNEFAKKGEPLPVVSPGTQIRNFTDVRDIVAALIIIAEEGSGDGYGIGSEKDYTILQLAQMFSNEIYMLPERRGNRLSAPVNSEKTKLLNWRCNYNLESYVRNLKANW
jgi:UDP-glucose 4-epimerase